MRYIHSIPPEQKFEQHCALVVHGAKVAPHAGAVVDAGAGVGGCTCSGASVGTAGAPPVISGVACGLGVSVGFAVGAAAGAFTVGDAVGGTYLLENVILHCILPARWDCVTVSTMGLPQPPHTVKIPFEQSAE